MVFSKIMNFFNKEKPSPADDRSDSLPNRLDFPEDDDLRSECPNEEGSDYSSDGNEVKEISNDDFLRLAFFEIMSSVDFDESEIKNKILEDMLWRKKAYYGWMESCGLLFTVANGFPTWRWRDFEEHRDYLSKNFTEWPFKQVRFSPSSKRLDKNELLSSLTVNDLKQILEAVHTQAPSKAKKQELIDILLKTPNLDDIVTYQHKEQAAFIHNSNLMFYILMRDVAHRYSSLKILYDYLRKGYSQFDLEPDPSDSADLLQQERAKRPNAIPPLFPGDRSRLVPRQ